MEDAPEARASGFCAFTKGGRVPPFYKCCGECYATRWLNEVRQAAIGRWIEVRDRLLGEDQIELVAWLCCGRAETTGERMSWLLDVQDEEEEMPIRPELKPLYPDNWAKISAQIRFERAKGRCERCGHAHGTRRADTGKIEYLTTAHLDHDPTNNDVTNLAALCQTWHNRNDGKNRAANRKHNAHRDAGQLRMEYGQEDE